MPKNIISIWESQHPESNTTAFIEILRRKQADLLTVCNISVHIPIPISSREENSIQYMAGYVVAKLLQRFKKPVKQPLFNKKNM